MLTKIMFLIFTLLMLASCQQKEASSVMSGDFYTPEYQVTPPLNKWHKLGETVSFTLILPYDVMVTGLPYVNSVIGSTNRRFYYSSGSGTKTLTFTYTVLNGDLDTNGISFAQTITLNGGSLTYTDTAGEQKDAPLAYNIPSNNARVDGVKATLSSVVGPNAGIYTTNQFLNYTLNFSEEVYVAGTQPYITLNLASGTVNAEYVSGTGTTSLKFRRKILSSDIDGDGISSNTTLYNSSSITDGAGNSISSAITAASSPSTIVNTVAPIVSTVNPPANATYGVGQNLTFQLTMSSAVAVTGVPKLQVNLTTGIAYANYSGIDATNTVLSFTYTAATGQADFDGVSLAPQILLSGGTITAISNGQSAVLGFSPPSMPNVKVDAVDGPSAILSTVPVPGTYSETQNLDISLSFNNSVIVTGTPRIKLLIGGSTVYATYNSGLSTSGTLVFRYTVQTGVADTDGINVVSPIELNGGSIVDSLGRNANLFFSSGSTASVFVDGENPYVVSITSPGAGMYSSGTSLDFVFSFNEAVTVTGTPSVQLTLDSGAVSANFISGSGTNTLTFRYVPLSGNYDTSGGPVMVSPINLNGGSITDVVSHNAVLTFTSPSLTSILIDSAAPTVSSITPPANATYAIGSQISVTVNWSEAVVINSNPTLPITLNTGGTVYATYTPVGSTSTTSVFKYTVTEGTLDSDGISIVGPISLGSGSIRDNAGNNATLTFATPSTPLVKVDGIRPQITVPSVSTPGTYVAGQSLEVTLPWTEDIVVIGSPTMNITIGSTQLTMNFLATASPNIIKFSYTIAANDFDNNGVTVQPLIFLNGGSIKDTSGNDAILIMTLPSMSTVFVDAVLPGSTSTVISPDGTYNFNEFVDLKVFWNEDVVVTGTPRLSITVGTLTRYMNYVASESTPLMSVFRYDILIDDLDTNGITFNPSIGPIAISLNSGTIKDLAGNNAVLAVSRPDSSGVMIDGTTAVVTSITAPTGTSILGDDLDITVTYSKAIDVTGTPSIDILVGSNYRQAYYVSGSGSANLVFRYTVSVPEEQKTTGIYVKSPVALNGGTMNDSIAGNAAKLTYTNRWLLGTFIDSLGPYVTAAQGYNQSSVVTKYFKAGQTIYIHAQFQENFILDTTGGSPTLSIDVGGITRIATFSSSTTNKLIFQYTLNASNADLDLDGISVNGIVLNGATLEDSLGNTAVLNFSLTNSIFAYYNNMIVRYNFRSENITQSTCGTQLCTNIVKDISGNGSNATSSLPGPVIKTGFGTQGTRYIELNETSYLDLPDLNNLRYYFFVFKAPTNVSLTALTKNHVLLTGDVYWNPEDLFGLSSNFSQKKTEFVFSSRFSLNGTSFTTYGTTFTSPAWVPGNNYVYAAHTNGTIDATNVRVGEGFSGQLSEIILLDSSATLSTAQLTRIQTQLNAIHGVY